MGFATEIWIGSLPPFIEGRVARWKERWCVIDGAERKECWEERIAGRRGVGRWRGEKDRAGIEHQLRD
jgi:hypothetical protein